jgi:Bcl-2 antagonist/killer family protein
VTVIQRGIRGFFSNVVGFVVRFILSEKIAKWIAEQGGWVSLRGVSDRPMIVWRLRAW